MFAEGQCGFFAMCLISAAEGRDGSVGLVRLGRRNKIEEVEIESPGLNELLKTRGKSTQKMISRFPY